MTETYLRPDAALPYCKGCGHGLVLRALGSALGRLNLPAVDVAIVTDIGCVGLADSLFGTPHTIHTTHGRSTAFATGLGLADSVMGRGRLKPIVMIGDGGAMIGINHLIHAALLNPDLTVLVHNNFLFGMTGGQNSSFSPLDFVTSTTPDGQFVPPLDLMRVLMASQASFVARRTAHDRELVDVIASAISHPGFAVVEILELCTGYATRWNPLTGAKLAEVASRAGYEMGTLRDVVRPTFADSRPTTRRPPRPGPGPVKAAGFQTNLGGPLELVLAGKAGEHVQTAASLLARAALLTGLHATQKNDNPVTQGSGFSISEVLLSPEEILFTGIESPHVVMVVAPEGGSELAASGVYARTTPGTVFLVDDEIGLPDVSGVVRRLPFRNMAGPGQAALAAVAHYLAESRILPLEALGAAIDGRFGEAGREIKKSVFPPPPTRR